MLHVGDAWQCSVFRDGATEGWVSASGRSRVDVVTRGSRRGTDEAETGGHAGLLILGMM